MTSTRLAAVAVGAALVLTTAVEAQAQDCGSTYTIRQGETLGAIATRCGSTVEALMQANPRITDPARISVGWELVVPGRDDAAALTGEWARERDARAAPVLASGRYKVEKGDSMASIATALGVPLRALIAANAAADPFSLQPGQELVLPDPGPAARDADEESEVSAAADPGKAKPAGAESDAGAWRYTVEKGDSMASIAAARGVSLAALLAANEAVEPRALQPGQELVLPGGDPAANDADDAPEASAGAEAAAAPATADADADAAAAHYTVEKGDSMASIAAALGLPLGALLAVNEAVDPRALQPGQELVLPGGDPAANDADDAPEAEAAAEPAGTSVTADEIAVAEAPEDRAPERLTLEGRVQKGTECPVLRTPEGRLYSLVSQTYSFTPGQYVTIEGEPVEMSFCAQQTVRVTSMTERPAPQGG